MTNEEITEIQRLQALCEQVQGLQIKIKEGKDVTYSVIMEYEGKAGQQCQVEHVQGPGFLSIVPFVRRNMCGQIDNLLDRTGIAEAESQRLKDIRNQIGSS